jgi:hypothetical protein
MKYKTQSFRKLPRLKSAIGAVSLAITLGCMLLLQTTAYGQSGNHVFEGAEGVNRGTKDLTISGDLNWSTFRGATPGYFSAVGTASYINAADTPHVDGYVKHYADAANQAFSFPVGSSIDYRELIVSGTRSDTAELGVAWIVGDPTSTADPTAPNAGNHAVTSFGTGITAVSTTGQWDWQDLSSDAVGSTVTVSIPDMTALGAAADLRLVGWDGTEWVNLSGTSGASGNTEDNTLSGTMIAGITALGIGKGETDVCLSAKVFLQGALLLSANSTMNDDLRVGSLIPSTEPYTALTGFTHSGSGGGETIGTGVVSTTGTNAIVDWVFIELRNKTTNTTIVETRSALVQRDGDIVSAVDGTSAVCFSGLVDPEVYVSVRHRNHLGVMIAATKTLTAGGATADFSTETLYGTNAVVTQNTVSAMWAGDANSDGDLKYQGASNDAVVILNEVLGAAGNTGFFGSGAVPGYTYTNQYRQSDVNMNGEIKYQGANNDAILILNNVLSHPGNTGFFGSGAVPGYTAVEQLP